MSIPVELDALRAEIERFVLAPYLLTVSASGSPHAVAVSPSWTDGAALQTSAGRRTAANAAARPTVSLLWPPAERDGYSLIVDGVAAVGDSDGDEATVTITPTKAVLHRPAPGPRAADGGPGCTADCVPLLTERA